MFTHVYIVYHLKCIDPWLTRNRRVCPVCKAKVRLPGVPESSASEEENDNANERTPLVEPQRNRPTGRTRTRQNRNRTERTGRVRANRTSNSTPQSYQAVDDSFVPDIASILEGTTEQPQNSHARHGRSGRHHGRHNRHHANNNNTNQGAIHHQQQHPTFDHAEPSTSSSHQQHHEISHSPTHASTTAVIEVERHEISHDHHDHTDHYTDHTDHYTDYTIDV